MNRPELAALPPRWLHHNAVTASMSAHFQWVQSESGAAVEGLSMDASPGVRAATEEVARLIRGEDSSARDVSFSDRRGPGGAGRLQVRRSVLR